MHLKRVCRTLLIGQLAVLSFAAAAWATSSGEVTVYAIGSSRIVGEDRASAREEAIRSALVMAVSRAVTETLPIESVSGNFKIVNETILNRTDQFLRDYKVMAESVAGGTYRLLVQATVLVDQLRQRVKSAGLVLEKVPLPSILVAYESPPGDTAAQAGAAAQPEPAARLLAQIFARQGFKVVEADTEALSAAALPAGPAEIMDLGRRFGAEVVVVASAGPGPAVPSLPGQASGRRASVRTAAFRTLDGQSLVQVEKSALGEISGQGEAQVEDADLLRKTLSAAGEELCVKLTQAWARQAALGNRIEIGIQGVSGRIADFVKFRGALREISGVENLHLKELSSDKAILTLNFHGSPQSLAENVQQRVFDTFQVRIEKVDTGAIEMRLAPR